MKIKTLLLLACAAGLLQSCMLTSKMDKIVSLHYANKHVLTTTDNKNNFELRTDSLKRVNGYCQSNYKSFYTVPLLIYYYSDEKIICTINPKFYVNAIVNGINKQLENETLKEKLNGKVLELSFNKLPTTFNHHYNNHTVLLQFLIVQFSSVFTKNELHYPQNTVRISYTIKDKNSLEVIKKGALSELLNGVSEKKYNGIRRKRFVENFVNSYDQTMDALCNALVQKLISEL